MDKLAAKKTSSSLSSEKSLLAKQLQLAKVEMKKLKIDHQNEGKSTYGYSQCDIIMGPTPFCSL